MISTLCTPSALHAGTAAMAASMIEMRERSANRTSEGS